MQPKVSIIVPCYGVEKYIDRCMESLVNQTLRDIEIILVDDVSPDRVPEMCDEWAKKDNRIKVIHKEKNGGLGFARNTGLDAATGEYVAFVDSDDYVDVQMYETLFAIAKDANCDTVFCGVNIENQPGLWEKHIEVDKICVLDKSEAWTYAKDMIACLPGIKKERLHEMSVWHSIYNLSIIRDNQLTFLSERDVASEDIPFQIDFFRHVNRMAVVPFAFYYYCFNGASLTTTFKKEKHSRFAHLRDVLIDKMGDDPEAAVRADRFFIGCSRAFFLKLVNTPISGKISIIREVLNEGGIWEKVRKDFEIGYLPKAQSVFYLFQSRKMPIALFVYAKLFILLKQMCGKKILA